MHQSAPNVEEIFLAAIELEGPESRASYLDKVCGDTELRRHIERLLALDARASGFLEPVGPVSTLTGESPGLPEGAGVVIGPYKLLEPIGEGGMGIVYLAEQMSPVRRRVALKVIKAGMDSRQVMARFEAERQALALMEHPNIARVLDASTTEQGRPYFVMELVKGTPITSFCDDRRLTLRERLELLIPVCQAVQHAHQKGIIHRDLKPSNVLVGLYDGTPIPKVIDFGVAKAIGQKLTEHTLFTAYGAIIGTPQYMSPEQARIDNIDIDTRSDVYSLGVLLYELLTGTTPLDRDRHKETSLLEVLRIVREEEPPRPSTRLSKTRQLPEVATNRNSDPKNLRVTIRGELDWIALKAIEKNRNRRYETALELARDLSRYLQNEPVSACPPSAAYRLRKFSSRNRTAIGLALVIGSVLVLATLVSGWQALRATRAEQETRIKVAELAMDKGQLLGESGDANLALLWLSRGLLQAPREAAGLKEAIGLGLHAWRRRVHSLRMTLRHEGRVNAVAFAADGNVLTASWDNASQSTRVRRWDANTGLTMSELILHRNSNLCQILSPDARYFLTDYTDGRIGLFDLSTGVAAWHQREGPGERIRSACFSPDGKTILIGFEVSRDREGLTLTGRAQRLDRATGTWIGPSLPFERAVMGVAFHPDGRHFVTTTGNWGNETEPEVVRFWDLDGREYRGPLRLDCMAPDLTFSPDGTSLLTGHWDYKARLWNLADPGEPVVFQHDAPIFKVMFSPDGRRVLTGSWDSSVRVWDLGGKLLGSPLRQGHMVRSMASDRGGMRLLVGNSDGLARVWELAPEDRTNRSEPNDPTSIPLAVSPDGRTIMTRDSQHTVVIRDAVTNRVVGVPLLHRRPVLIGGTSMVAGQRQACSSDRRRALTVDDANVARLWDTRTGTLIRELDVTESEQAPGTFYAASFSPDSRWVVTGNFTWTAYVWDATSGEQIKKLMHEVSGPIFKVSFIPDGRTLITAGADRAVRFWDIRTWEEAGSPLMHITIVFSMSLSPDGRTILTGDLDRSVQLWDVATRRRLLRLSGHRGGVYDAVFSRDGQLALTSSADHTARLWHLASGKPIGPPFEHEAPVIRVAFGADGKSIQSATLDQITRSWPIPEAMTGTAEEIAIRVQVDTGMELDADGGVQMLEVDEWQRRRDELMIP